MKPSSRVPLVIWVLFAVLAMFSLFVSVFGAFAAELPVPPASAPVLGIEPLKQCGENWGIYVKAYDLNPQTEAQFNQAGVYEGRDSEPVLSDPVVAVILDDAGVPTIYVKDREAVTIYDKDAFRAKYPDPCKLPRAGIRT